MINLISYTTNRFQILDYFVGIDLIKNHLIKNGFEVNQTNITIDSYPYDAESYVRKNKSLNNFQYQIPEIFQLEPIIKLIENYKSGKDLLYNNLDKFTDDEIKSLYEIINIANNFKVKDGDIIGQQVLYLFLFHCLLFILQIKRNNPDKKIITVFGGYHITLSKITREFLSKFDFVDYLVINDGRKPMVDIASNQVKEKIIEGKYKDVKIEHPIYKSIEVKLKEKKLQMITGTGCPNSCKFCASERECTQLNLSDIKKYLIDQYKIYPFSHLNIVDDAINPSKERIKDICELFIELRNKHNVKFTWNAHACTLHIDDELIILLNKSGCTNLFLGTESFDDEILLYINKNCDSKKSIEAITKLSNSGIKVKIGIIVNLPGENHESFMKTYNVLKEIKNDNVMIVPTIFKLFPNSYFYKHPAESNIMITNWDQKIVDKLEEIKGMIIPKEWYYINNKNESVIYRIHLLMKLIDESWFPSSKKDYGLEHRGTKKDDTYEYRG